MRKHEKCSFNILKSSLTSCNVVPFGLCETKPHWLGDGEHRERQLREVKQKRQ